MSDAHFRLRVAHIMTNKLEKEVLHVAHRTWVIQEAFRARGVFSWFVYFAWEQRVLLQVTPLRGTLAFVTGRPHVVGITVEVAAAQSTWDGTSTCEACLGENLTLGSSVALTFY
jgi:hypothetical protein